MIVSASALPNTRVRPPPEPGVIVPRSTITVPSPLLVSMRVVGCESPQMSMLPEAFVGWLGSPAAGVTGPQGALELVAAPAPVVARIWLDASVTTSSAETSRTSPLCASTRPNDVGTDQKPAGPLPAPQLVCGEFSTTRV